MWKIAKNALMHVQIVKYYSFLLAADCFFQEKEIIVNFSLI